MNPTFPTTFQSSFEYVSTQTLTQLSFYVPKVLGAFLILLIGSAIAKACRRVVIKLLEALMVSKLLKNTPVEHFIQNAEVSQKIEDIIGSIMYWLIMLVVIHTSVSVLGLQSLTGVLNQVLGYIPQVFSAILVLFFGILLAGVVESIVKGSIKSIDGQASRLLGKVSSYLVITLSILAAISELGIARDFIMILFVGFVVMVSLGVGLAVGLGGQDVVRQVLNSWYKKTWEDIKE